MQHIPKVTDADIERLVGRDFCNKDRVGAIQILQNYGKSDYHREIRRVRAAIIKLAQGSVPQLKLETENACRDYRDTLLAAEYPNDAKVMFKADKLSKEVVREIDQKDKAQYLAWFNR